MTRVFLKGRHIMLAEMPLDKVNSTLMTGQFRAVKSRVCGECSAVYEFGEFQLAPKELLLMRNGQPVPLSDRAFSVLQILVERAGHLVEKAELLDIAWSGCHVGDGNLTVAISLLRKTLGDPPEEQRLIKTVFGHGYRFVGEVRELSHIREETTGGGFTKGEPQIQPPDHKGIWSLQSAPFLIASLTAMLFAGMSFWLTKVTHGASTTVSQIHSLVVMPFQTNGGSPANAKLSSELADELIAQLGEDENLSIRTTKAGIEPVTAGKEQKVDAVLTGTITGLDEHVRVSAELVRVRDGSALWHGVLEKPANLSLELEDQLAENVEEILSPGRRAKPSTPNPDPAAERLYQEGRSYWNKRTEDGIRRSIEYFDGAILKDPKYALAYAGLADSYITLGMHNVRTVQDSYPNAEAAARKALELDDTLAEAHASLGQLALYYEWDWAKAGTELRRAIRLNPNLTTPHAWYAADLAAGGRMDEALNEALRAEQLDPSSPAAAAELGRIYYLRREYDRAIAVLQRSIALSPQYPIPYRRLGLTYLMQGKSAAALSTLRQAEALFPTNVETEGLIAYVEATSGNLSGARRILAELNRRSADEYVPAFTLALASMAVGDRNAAFGWFEKCKQERPASLVFASVDPLFDSVRADSRFAALMADAGFAHEAEGMVASVQ